MTVTAGKNGTMAIFTNRRISDQERRDVEDFVARGQPVGRSGPCVCDDCIRRIWRPVMKLTRGLGWPGAPSSLKSEGG